ncbi:trehalose 6-phosphate phosphatase [Thermocatellispora tengchongensis]|uniref:Trehalose 6-phosphate phosphatase n=1 Tax=Thermocatellispora tengchongensis TaxID=1073253 RepID=A0A840PIX7_9ACTN|nr:trehalose-phosphatase [Thermocatellispora tengchongensis]MBB5139488.1 trehalose 6-phosphate phosphatase [Thermocatellispora tengchongensis]
MTDEVASVLPPARTAAGAVGLDAIVSDPSGAVIGLDFDGTLSPIVPDPASARVHPEAPGVLAELGPMVGAIVVLTGRPAAVAIEYGASPGPGPGLTDVPGLVVLGQYGAERWEAGEVTSPPPPRGVDAVRGALPGVLLSLGVRDAYIEDKGRALAVHTRRSADPDATLGALRGPLARLAREHGLTVEPGKMVIELRPPGVDKGHALRAFLAERGARSVLFAGDDLGDLAAYNAVRESGLPGVTVCSRSHETAPELADRADLIVEGPDGVVALLRALTRVLGKGQAAQYG